MRLLFVSLLCLAGLPSTTHAQGFAGGGGIGKTVDLEIMQHQLEHADAEEVVSILNNLFQIKFSSNSKTNTIYARASKEDLQEAQKVIDQMEKASEEVDKNRVKTRTPGPVFGGGLGRARKGSGKSQSRTTRSTGGLGGLGAPAPISVPAPNVPEIPRIDLKQVDALRAELMKLVGELTRDRQSITKELLPMIAERVKMEVELGPQHPKVRTLEKQIDGIREELLKSLPGVVRHRADRPSIKFAVRHSELETEVSKIVEKFRDDSSKELPKEETKKIKENLTESVGKLFDVRQQAEEADLKQATEQLEKIGRRLEERKKNRSSIIQERVESLLADGGGD